MCCDNPTPIIDQHEGSEVCSSCGLVLNFVICHENINYKDELFNNNSIFIEYLHRLNAPSTLYVECENFLSNLTIKNEREALTLYVILLHQKIPRTLKEICSVTGSNTNILWKSLAEYQKTSGDVSIIHPIDLTERACSILGLSFQNSNQIKKKVLSTYNNFPNHHPSSIVGMNIYTHCKENKVKLSMKEIAEHLSISVISIRRLLKHTDKK